MEEIAKLVAFYRFQQPASASADWQRVSAAQPAFAGHQQPRLPADPAYSSPGSLQFRQQEALLARSHGIFGFCYFYPVDRSTGHGPDPLAEDLGARMPDFPFCLCLEFDFSDQTQRTDNDDLLLMRQIAAYLRDPRQIKLQGRPMLLVSQPDRFPDMERTVKLWRTELRQQGVEPFFVGLDFTGSLAPQLLGLDASCDFPPYGIELPDDRDAVSLLRPFGGRVFDYEKLVHLALRKPNRLHAAFGGIVPGWDDTPLLGDEARIYANGSPEKYNYWLSELVEDATRRLVPDNRFVFVNSWNDWLHGACLVPDRTLGAAYLEATKAALQGERWGRGDFLEKHRYAEWVTQRYITPGQRQQFEQRIETAWPKRYEFHIAVVHEAGVPESELLRSLKSLGSQFYPQVKLSVVATVPPPAAMKDAVGQYWDIVAPSELVATANACLTNSSADWVGMIRSGDTVSDYAFLSIGEAIHSHRDWQVLYTDDDEQDALGNCLNHRFKPDFNLDFARSCPRDLGDVVLVSRQMFSRLGGFDSQAGSLAAQDLVFRVLDAEGIGAIGHVPDVLIHLRRRTASADVLQESRLAGYRLLQQHLERRGVAAAIEDGLVAESYRIRYQHPACPLVSIIIPTKDKVAVLQRCIESLLEKTRYPAYEVLIVDNGSVTPEARAYLDGIRGMGIEKLKVLEYPQEFNYSAMNNLAAREAAGEYLLLLNNDTAIVDGGWLDAMMNHALRPEVGVVGARLSYPNGRVQHAGVVLGVKGPAEHPFIGNLLDDPGYMGRALVDQDYSAVTGACLLVRKSLFDQVGGLDDVALKVSYSDIDLCLKIRELGYNVVWTPYAILLHEGSASQNSNVETKKKEDKLRRFAAEQDEMYRRWPDVIARDPAYNQNLALYSTQFQINVNIALANDPVSWKPIPNLLAMPADRQGSGFYRIIHPSIFSHSTGSTRSRVCSGYPPVATYRQLEIDTLFSQRQVNDEQLKTLERYRKILDCKLVMDFDDLLTAVPYRSVHKKDIFKDIGARLRMAAAVVDRVTASTEPLAEYFRGMAADVRVVPNALFPPFWDGLQPQRRTSAKPRVGWAGGVSHDGDLAVIVDVIKELAGEVDWIFMGMCPDAIRPYIAEFHAGADISLYPARLAALNLDLAVAPLEHNKFNECKSNLRILEYGVLGYPVVATNFTPYQDGFPVTLVKNRFKDWVAAIRDHINDLDETARRGDALRQVIRENWMLDKRLNTWLAAWNDW